MRSHKALDDAFKRPLAIGQKVTFVWGKYNVMRLGEVIRFTPKRIVVHTIQPDGSKLQRDIHRAPDQVSALEGNVEVDITTALPHFFEFSEEFPLEYWRYSVARKETLLGYHHWVKSKEIEKDKNNA